MLAGMMACKRCGKPKDKTDRQCPHCGKGKITVMHLLLWLIIAATVVIGGDAILSENKGYQVWKQFSIFDGSHDQLEDWVIDNLNDPKSYEHVETKHEMLDGNLLVKTKYRAANAMGGIVISRAAGLYTVDGKEIDVGYDLDDDQKKLLKQLLDLQTEIEAAGY